MWSDYAAYFADGIPFGDIISSIFIIGLCAIGLIYARTLYKRL